MTLSALKHQLKPLTYNNKVVKILLCPALITVSEEHYCIDLELARAQGYQLIFFISTGSASATSGSTIIGQNTGVFIGGIPENFTLLRQDTGNLSLNGMSW